MTIKANSLKLHNIDHEIKKLRNLIRNNAPEFFGWICKLLRNTKTTHINNMKNKHTSKFNHLLKQKLHKQKERIKQVSQFKKFTST